jgi:hypothetical protein
VLNTDAKMEIDDEKHIYIPKGNPVEEGLLKYLSSANVDVHEKLVDRERQF